VIIIQDMKIIYPKDFFKLQLDFINLIKDHFNKDLKKCLFFYTCFYVRLLGFHDEHPPDEKDKRWQKIINKLPSDKNLWIDYFYKGYIKFEKNKPKQKKDNQVRFGRFSVFSYSYHKDENAFELHFGNRDPKGNLGRDRVSQRMFELKKMFKSMKSCKKRGAKVYLRTWLFNINAFQRLFPKEFWHSAGLWNKQLAQDLAHWGQFVDRKGNFKKELAKILLKKAKKKRKYINEYFPLPCKRSEVDQKAFYRFYF